MPGLKEILTSVNDVLAGVGGIVMTAYGKDGRTVEVASKAVDKLIDLALPGEKAPSSGEGKPIEPARVVSEDRVLVSKDKVLASKPASKPAAPSAVSVETDAKEAPKSSRETPALGSAVQDILVSLRSKQAAARDARLPAREALLQAGWAPDQVEAILRGPPAVPAHPSDLPHPEDSQVLKKT